MNNSSVKKSYIYILLLFVASCIFLSIRSMFGYCFNDEPFIVTLAQRISFGDSLFIDEWNFAQNFGVIILPLYNLYVSIFGSTEGILLCFRFVYSILWSATCVWLYSVLRQKYKYSFFIFLYLILFSPLDQMTLSYTSISFMCCLILTGLFLYNIEIKQIKWYVFSIIFSFVMVIMVVSSPYTVVFYLGFFIFAIAYRIIKKNDFSKYYFKVLLLSLIIVLTCAVLYVIRFMLNNYTLSEFIAKLPDMFINSRTFGGASNNKIIKYFGHLVINWYLFGAFTTVCLFLLCFKKIRNSSLAKFIIFTLSVLVFVLEQFLQFFKVMHTAFNQQMVAIVFLGVLSFFMLKNKKENIVPFCCFMIFGFVHSFISYMSSDTKMNAIAMGLAISGIGSIIFIVKFIDELKSDLSFNKDKIVIVGKKTLSILFSIVMLFQFALQIYFKLDRQYTDSHLYKLKAQIDFGAAKGIYTTPHYKERYETFNSSMLELMQNVDKNKKDEIRFLSLLPNPVLYLNAEMPIGAYSAWTFKDFESKSNKYYEAHPEKYTNVIFYSIKNDILSNFNIDVSDFVKFQKDEFVLLVKSDFVK